MKKLIFLLISFAFRAVSFGQPAFDVEKSGKGDPILFLPGFTCPGNVWNETVAHLSGRHKVYLVTYAGFGGVAPIKTPWYPALRDQLITYLQEQDLKGLTIVGHSMGGTLALDIAAAVPDRVERIVSVDALPCMRDLMMPGVPADKIVYDNPYSKQMLAMEPDAFRANANMFAEAMTNTQEKKATLVQWIVEADRQTYVNGYTDLLRTDVRPELGKIKAKSLVIAASFPDKAMVTANMEKQYANLQNKEIVIADNSKHFVMFDQPDWFYQQVNAFLKK